MVEKNIPIDVICKFEGDPCKAPMPLKFRLTKADGSRTTVDVDQVVNITHVGPMGNHMIVYSCITTQDSRQIKYELRFWVNYMKWELYRM